MGQRLVITIHAFDEDIATIYYHWSAYTTSALQEAKDIIEMWIGLILVIKIN